MGKQYFCDLPGDFQAPLPPTPVTVLPSTVSTIAPVVTSSGGIVIRTASSASVQQQVLITSPSTANSSPVLATSGITIRSSASSTQPSSKITRLFQRRHRSWPNRHRAICRSQPNRRHLPLKLVLLLHRPRRSTRQRGPPQCYHRRPIASYELRRRPSQDPTRSLVSPR